MGLDTIQYLQPESATAFNAGVNSSRQFETEQADRERTFARKLLLSNLIAKHTNDEGKLNGIGFLGDASKAGIADEAFDHYLKNNQAQANASVDIANKSNALEILGRNPDALRSWGDNGQPAQPAAPEAAPMSGAQRELVARLGVPRTNAPTSQPVAAPVQPQATQQAAPVTEPDPFAPDEPNTIRITAQGQRTPAHAGYTAEDFPTGPSTAVPQRDTILEQSLRKRPEGEAAPEEDTFGKVLRFKNFSDTARQRFNESMGNNGLPQGDEGIAALRTLYRQPVQKAKTITGKDGSIDVFATKNDKIREQAELAAADKQLAKDILGERVGKAIEQRLANRGDVRTQSDFDRTNTAIKNIERRFEGAKVPAAQLSKAQELAGKIEGIHSLIAGTKALKEQIKREPNMSAEKFGALVAPLDNQISVADQITTEGQTNKFFADLERRDPSLGQLIAHSKGGGVGALLDAAKRNISSLKKSQIVNLYETIGEHALKYGVASAQMRGLGWKGPQSGAEKQLGEGLRKKDLSPKKEGESMADYFRRKAGK